MVDPSNGTVPRCGYGKVQNSDIVSVNGVCFVFTEDDHHHTEYNKKHGVDIGQRHRFVLVVVLILLYYNIMHYTIMYYLVYRRMVDKVVACWVSDDKMGHRIEDIT